MVTHVLYPFQIFCNAFSYQNANKGVRVHRPKSLVEVNQAITRLISIESQPKKVVVVVFVVVGLVVVVGVGVLIIVGHRNLTESLIKIGSLISHILLLLLLLSLF